MTSILLTAVLAFIGFAAGQLALKLWVDPFIALRARIGTVASDLVLYGQQTDSPAFCSEQMRTGAAMAFRLRAAQLSGDVHALLWWRVFVCAKWLPARESCLAAASALIGLSNSVQDKDSGQENQRYVSSIRAALNIPSPGDTAA